LAELRAEHAELSGLVSPRRAQPLEADTDLMYSGAPFTMELARGVFGAKDRDVTMRRLRSEGFQQLRPPSGDVWYLPSPLVPGRRALRVLREEMRDAGGSFRSWGGGGDA
jgi:hypothetical protein